MVRSAHLPDCGILVSVDAGRFAPFLTGDSRMLAVSGIGGGLFY